MAKSMQLTASNKMRNAAKPTTTATPKVSAIEKARAMAKSITADAKTAVVATTVAAPKATTQAAQVVSTEFYQQKVTSAGAEKVGKPNTFFGTVQALATKPITLEALIAKAVEASKFTSKKDHSFVARVRVRHALTRLGYLTKVA